MTLPTRVELGELEKTDAGLLSVKVVHPELGSFVIRTLEIEKQGEEEAFTAAEVEFERKPAFSVTYKNGSTTLDWEWHMTNTRVVTAWVEDAEHFRSSMTDYDELRKNSMIPLGLVAVSYRNGNPEDVGATV